MRARRYTRVRKTKLDVAVAKARLFAYASAGVVFVFAAIYVSMLTAMFFYASKVDNLEKQIAQLNTQISELEQEYFALTQSQDTQQLANELSLVQIASVSYLKTNSLLTQAR